MTIRSLKCRECLFHPIRTTANCRHGVHDVIEDPERIIVRFRPVSFSVSDFGKRMSIRSRVRIILLRLDGPYCVLRSVTEKQA